MSSSIDTVKAWIWTDGAKDNAHLLSDDFVTVDSEGNVTMDKQGFLGMQHLLHHALPDIRYVLSDIYDEGDGVVIDGHFEGTFENDLDLSAAGMGVIPANGKRIVWPSSTAKFVVAGDQILREVAHGEDNGGVEAFLAPLKA